MTAMSDRPALAEAYPSTEIWRMSDRILVSSVTYLTLLGRPPSYFIKLADSELGPCAVRQMSVPPHQRPELIYYGQNSSSAAKAASYPTRRAGSRDCGCMVRSFARRRCGIIVS